MIRFFYGLVAGMLLTMPAFAQTFEPIGTISADLDGNAMEWSTLTIPSENTASADFARHGPVSVVSIQGHDLTADSIMQNVLSLHVSIMGEDAAGADVTVAYFPDGMGRPFFSSEELGEDAVLSFDRLELSDGGTAEGSFSARLCRREGFMSEPDLDDCRVMEGRFSTSLVATE